MAAFRALRYFFPLPIFPSNSFVYKTRMTSGTAASAEIKVHEDYLRWHPVHLSNAEVYLNCGMLTYEHLALWLLRLPYQHNDPGSNPSSGGFQ